MKTKRVISLLLLVALLVTGIAGCSRPSDKNTQSSAAAAESGDEPIIVKIAILILQHVQPIFGVNG